MLHIKKRLAMLLVGAIALGILGTIISIKNIEKSDVTGAVSLEGIRLQEAEAPQDVFEDRPHFTEDEILAMTPEEQEELKQLRVLDINE